MSSPYHHGDLRDAFLAAAAETIELDGPSALSLRSLATSLGVSHTAPRHHFGSREGVLTALATQGFDRLEVALLGAGDSFLELGVAYVEFAASHRGHFAVMFSPDLLDGEDPALVAARGRTFARLAAGADRQAPGRGGADHASTVLAAWSLVHGLAQLVLSGSVAASGLDAAVGATDLRELVRRTAVLLFRSPGGRPTEGDRS